MRRRLRLARFAAVSTSFAIAACGWRAPVPSYVSHDAAFGFLAEPYIGSAEPPSKDDICESWMTSVVERDPLAVTHTSFPESDPIASCFVPVRFHGDDDARATTDAPRGCAFPDADQRIALAQLAAALDRIATDAHAPNPYFSCGLSRDVVTAVARHDARVLRALIARDSVAPYAAVIVPGHGLAAQDASPLLHYGPADPNACVALSGPTFGALGGMIQRTRRAAALIHGGVAPIAIVSGGAVHSRLIEAFAMMHLLTCPRPDVAFDPVAADRVLLEPCADHTHTNLRDSGRLLAKMKARAGFIVTDDHFQADYFEDQTGLELISGSIDQRSLRDFGYLVGAWRRASIGNDAGFWFTPYRFWAEPRDGLGSLSCDDR
ncbi:MAG: hypothetical protein ABI461_15585 [Polyangiaceae bacterium]